MVSACSTIPSPLHIGDIVKTEVKTTSVINTNAGKAVKVIGNIIHEGNPVIEVTSSFLYCGCFMDYENTFEIIQEPNYMVGY
jgi:fatty acid synthase subunit beta